MAVFISKVVPIILVFFLGLVLQKLRLFQTRDGETLLKFVFYVTMPFLVLSSTSQMDFHISLIFIPFTAAIVNITFSVISYFIGKKLQLPIKQLGTFILGSSIFNTAFTLPFFIAAYSHEGLIRGSLFDIGNVFMIFTYFYYIAVKSGSERTVSKRFMIRKIVILPPLWGLVLGLTLNFLKINLPAIIFDFSTTLGDMTVPLVMLALGLIFHPKVKNLYLIVIVTTLRLFGGLLIGLLITLIIPMDNLTKVIVIIGASGPVGYNTLVLSAMENLDESFAASLVSISLIIGFFSVPFFIMIFHMLNIFSLI